MTQKPADDHRSSSAWLVALMAASVLVALGEGSLGVLLGPHLHARGFTEAAVGFAVATLSAAALVTRFVAGALYAPGRARVLLPAGSIASAASFVVIGASSHPLALVVAVAVNGIGFSLASTIGLAAIMDARRHGSAGSTMAWYTGANGAGFALSGFLGGAAGDTFGTAGAVAAFASIPLLSATIAALGLRSFGDLQPGATPPSVRRLDVLAGFRTAGPVVWLGFAVALHINLLGGMLTTYFPLFGLSVGLSLTQIGALVGMHSTASSSVRFLAGLIFRLVDPRRLTTWLVWSGGLAVAALPLSRSFAIFSIAWIVIGFSRGLLRTSSAALVMERARESENGRGSASAIYLAGLDLGKILGPLVGGAAIGLWSYDAAFYLAGLGFPLVYLVLVAFVSRRERRAVQPS